MGERGSSAYGLCNFHPDAFLTCCSLWTGTSIDWLDNQMGQLTMEKSILDQWLPCSISWISYRVGYDQPTKLCGWCHYKFWRYGMPWVVPLFGSRIWLQSITAWNLTTHRACHGTSLPINWWRHFTALNCKQKLFINSSWQFNATLLLIRLQHVPNGYQDAFHPRVWVLTNSQAKELVWCLWGTQQHF